MRPTPPPLRLLLLLVAGALPGCLPLGLGGVVDGQELSFVDVAYVELRELDVATSTPVHPIDVWLMPMEDPCTNFGPMTRQLADLREELDFGMSPEEYCDRWEGTFAEYVGHLDGFWVGWFRLQALPRAEDETPKTTYAFLEEDSTDTPDGPSFDLDLAWYPPTTFAACATEFEGDEFYAPTIHSADGGEVQVTSYVEDDRLRAVFGPTVDEAEENPLTGQAKPSFCTAALDWSIEFGLGGG